MQPTMLPACGVAAYLVYLLSMRFHARTAPLRIEHVRWLVKSIRQSATVVVSQPWIWTAARAVLSTICVWFCLADTGNAESAAPVTRTGAFNVSDGGS
jgi:hypothetical protein